MSTLSIAPKLGKTTESAKKYFEWWEAEHDRAKWEDDQVTEEERERRIAKWKELQKRMDMSWWTPANAMKPYHERKQSWKSKNTTLRK